jgi:hypothetical protein
LLREHIQPSPGDCWFAVGIRFNSFEMILSFALISVSFGHEVEMALLGMAKMTIPQGAEPGKTIAYAELALRAVIRPSEGSIIVEGRLTSESYIFSRDCHLAGGFAFYLWLSEPHAGDFVITLGGYHPKFLRPDHYPVVPRLGVNWQVTNELTISSEIYFALTSSCIMAGGRLSAVYRSGCIRAWFIAYADFLLNWKPLHYMADMGVNIGVEARIRFWGISFSIALHLNVGLHVWGPPFAGSIDIDLKIFTLKIRFGPAMAPPPPLTAVQFVDSFLPKQEVMATRISSGLIREEKREDKTFSIVNADALVLTAQSIIPVTRFDGLAPRDFSGGSEEPGIRPMGVRKLESSCTVAISGIANDRKNVRLSPVMAKVPESLWGKSAVEGKVSRPSAPAANLLSVCVGMQISFAPIELDNALPEMAIGKFIYDDFLKSIPWNDDLTLPPSLAADNKNSIKTVMDPSTVEARNKVLAILAAQKCPFALNEVNLQKLDAGEDFYFQAEPQYCRLGEACA